MEIRIGGVPEYFNLPVRLAVEKGGFERAGLQVEWVDYLQGTGRMASDLANGSLDLAVLLTEGAIKAIYEGNPSRIIKTHVNSPLIWGIHIPARAKQQTVHEVLQKRIAISRYGSGSHLMAVHLAQQLNISSDTLKFVVVNDLEGARDAFNSGEAEVFFWEKYTTKPLVDIREFKCIGEHPSPWPAFVIVASDHMISFYQREIQTFLTVINQFVNETRDLPNLETLIAERYTLKYDDVKLLLADLKWNDSLDFPTAFEEEILNTFETAKILGEEKRSELFFSC